MKACLRLLVLSGWILGGAAVDPSLAYDVVFTSGASMTCAVPPVCQERLCTLRLSDGALFSERVERIDFEATRVQNLPENRQRVNAALNGRGAPEGRAASARVPVFSNEDLSWRRPAAEGRPETVRNDDLPGMPLGSEVSGTPFRSGARSSEDLGYERVLDDDGRGEEFWRDRALGLDREIDRARARVELARKDYQETSRTLLFGRWIGAEPVEGNASPSFGVLEYPRTAEERAVWLYRAEESRQRLAEAESELDLLEQDRNDLMSEARRAGALPGWLIRQR